MLEALTSTVAQNHAESNQRFTKLEQGQAKLEQDLKEVKDDVKFIKRTLDYFAEDIGNLDNRVTTLGKV